MVRVGDKVRRMSEILSQQDEEKRSVRRPMVGKVTYIHPKRRFHVVEFELPPWGSGAGVFPGRGGLTWG